MCYGPFPATSSVSNPSKLPVTPSSHKNKQFQSDEWSNPMPSLHLIVAPPPTPNGDLHVGHMSGPYLAADIYRRQVLQDGHEAIYTVSTDDHQSYVDTTARRLGTDSES